MSAPIIIPIELLEFRVSRSSGPGGQHVNKTDTKVEALLHIASAPCFTEVQCARILQKLANKINKDGNLSVTCQQTRSQLTNKEKAVKKLNELINKALAEEKPRKPTKIPKAVNEKRIKAKKITGEKKLNRQDWKKLL